MARSYDDARDIPVIKCWEDMYSRPSFAKDIHGEKVQLLRVIAPYSFLTPHNPCGLTNCGTPNGSGYLILAVDGRETNIGSKCGKKHFPEFHAKAVQVDRIQREREIRENAAAAKSELPRLRRALESVRDESLGASWVDRCVRRLKAFLIDIDPVLWVSLQRRAAGSNSVVNRVRKLSKSERGPDQEFITQEGHTRRVRSQAYVEERVGRLQGLEVFLPDRDLHELVAKRAAGLIVALERCNPDQDRHKDLTKLLKEFGQFDSTLRMIGWSVDAGRQFFTAANLAMLPFITTDEDQHRRIAAIRLAALDS